MVVVLAPEQEATLALMALDVDLEPSELLIHLVSDRLAQYPLDLWRT